MPHDEKEEKKVQIEMGATANAHPVFVAGDHPIPPAVVAIVAGQEPENELHYRPDE
ncbi:hypothetical protein [Chitinophaga sp.]|uniref:hypothetical protein n=1 Tax=Chitinophaga sp. TaxID=1869181 RepID=UPI002634D0FB|nr:hypothetical protein [uncultured Chitinophaga sp.]